MVVTLSGKLHRFLVEVPKESERDRDEALGLQMYPKKVRIDVFKRGSAKDKKGISSLIYMI